MHNKIKRVYTLLFTEKCPLVCNYCNLRANSAWEKNPEYTKEEFFQAIEDHSDYDEILFTGGEPFCRWLWIKEAIEKYGNKFSYSFNTNGYYLTEDKLEFLSNYRVQFQLSLDGPREIAMWRRPNAWNQSYDYWDTVEKNIPGILYYFPNTAWKSIISRRIIPYIPKIYAAAASYGFKYIHLEPDFEEQPWRVGKEGEGWSKEDYEKYRLAVEACLVMMVESFKNGAYPLLEANMEKYLDFIMPKDGAPKEFNISSVNCGIAAKRGQTSVYSREDTFCMKNLTEELGITIEELFKKIEDEYTEGCQRDKTCPYFDYCARFICLKDNYTQTGHFLTSSVEQCESVKIWNDAVIKLLQIGNTFLFDNETYIDFVTQYSRKPGRKV